MARTAGVCEAIYVRQSKDKKDSLSIEGQIELCKRECSCPDTSLIYVDKGFSGKNTKRPGFQSMLSDVKEGKISKVIVYRLDRLSRSILDFGQLWNELELHQVEFVSVNEKFDTTTPMGRAMIYIIMVFAQLERETIGERVTDNYYTRIRHGSWPGGPAPYGMTNVRIKNENGGMVPSLDYNEDFKIVEEIFYRYASEDISLGNLAKDLTKRGISCRKRAGWDNVALARILHSPVYAQADEHIYRYYSGRGVKKFSNDIRDFTGEYSAHVVGKRTGNVRKYTDLEEQVVSLTNFPGKIPSDIWLSCQYKLDKNRQIGNSGKGRHTWLSGLLKCGKCGYSLSVRLWKDKKYLYCSGRGNLHICDRNSFSQRPEEIEQEVQKELEKILEECNREHVVIADDVTEAKYKLKIREIDEKIQRLVERVADASGVSMKYINKELEQLDLEREKLLNGWQKPGDDKRRYYQGIVFNQLDFDEKKMVAQAFVEKVKVYGDMVEIVWKM